MSQLRLSSRLDLVKPSITLAVTAKAAQLKAQGVDVTSFGAGEPDFDTPTHIKDAAKLALDKGQTKYTHIAGTPELRTAICAEMRLAHGLDVTPDQVIVSCGAKHSLYNLFQALLNTGDEVVIPAPYWVSYPDMVLLAGGTPVTVPTSAADGFLMSPAQLEAAITPRTRAVIINSPSNPTGAVYPRAALGALVEVALRHKILIISDEIYRRLAYDGPVTSPASFGPEAARATILIDGFSKTYSMTGWRLGYTVGPKRLIEAMTTIQGQSTSNPTSIAQAGAVAALTGPSDEPVEKMRLEFAHRRDVMVNKLNAMPHVKCLRPGGAFYAFPDLGAYAGKAPPGGKPLADDVALADWLLTAHKVAVVPGTGFGAPGFVRLSYATSLAAITIGLARIASGLAELS